MGALEVIVKRMVDKSARRFFFVTKPSLITVKGAPKKEVDVSFYPSDTHLGSRRLSASGEFYICGDDNKNGRVRLKDLYTVNIGKTVDFETEALDEKDKRSLQKIQWVPKDGALDAELLMTSGPKLEGKIEPAAKTLKVGEVVQLERLGFVRVDSTSPLRFVLTAR